MTDTGTNIMKEFEGEAMSSFMEFMLPKLLPQVEPVMNQIKKFLGNDEKQILLQVDKNSGQLVLIIIETEGIEALAITDGKFKVFPLDKYKDKLLSGGAEEIMKEFMDNK